MKNLITEKSQKMIFQHNVRLLNYFKKLALSDESEDNHYEMSIRRIMADFLTFLKTYSGIDVSLLANSSVCLFELRPIADVNTQYNVYSHTDAAILVQDHINFSNAFIQGYINAQELFNNSFLFSDDRQNSRYLEKYLRMVFGNSFINSFWDQLSAGNLRLSYDTVMFFPRFSAKLFSGDKTFSFQSRTRILTAILSGQTIPESRND